VPLSLEKMKPEDKQLESTGKSTRVGESMVQTPIKEE
jgi:hypothetical protein